MDLRTSSFESAYQHYLGSIETALEGVDLDAVQMSTDKPGDPTKKWLGSCDFAT